ncbi:hypothetical protein ACSLOV_23680, partial [Escherichia coli]
SGSSSGITRYQVKNCTINGTLRNSSTYNVPRPERKRFGTVRKLLDYSAHAWESFTAITLAYVLINAFIMLVMTLVERKVRLPGNMGGK